MKTLIFNGSPRKNGDTMFLIEKLKQDLHGEIIVINTFMSPIKPCCDCRFCWENIGCTIDDEMQEVYKNIIECDNIVIASPLYMSELTGSLLAVLSRLQMFYAAKRFLKTAQIDKKKMGGIIICGGGDGVPDKAISTAKTLFKFMNTTCEIVAMSLETDTVASRDDKNAIAHIAQMAALMNKGIAI